MTTEDLLSHKVRNKFQKDQEKIINDEIVSIYLKEHEGDRSINKYFHARNMLRERICANSRWEVTSFGFENRSDFSYNEETKEITYTSNRIMKRGDGFITNGTKIADDHERKCKEDLKALLKAEELINKLYLEHQEEIDKKLREHDKFNGVFVRPLNGPVNDEKKRIEDFIKDYGEIGLGVLIKWLNRLNEPSTNIKTLVKDFINDITTAKEYFVVTDNQAYRNSIIYSRPFEGLIMSLLSTYHPRGRVFNDTYNSLTIPNNTIRL